MPAADQVKNTAIETSAATSTAAAPVVAARAKLWPTLLVCAALAGLVLACFFRTMKDGYFLADDFGEFGYIQKIVGGRFDLFLANWTGNYMQIPSMAVYRPWQLMSLLTCYLIGRANPFPWYAANVLFYWINAVMLFLVCKQLTRNWSQWRSFTAASIAAALFVVNPLHCESVSWVVGRVDIECCSYFLLSTWAFLRYLDQRRGWQLGLSLVSFWLGMLVKEMAIGFPVLATALAFLAPDQLSDRVTLKERFIRTAKACWPVWLSTVIYFCVRYMALGTFTGGYIGTIGNGQSASAITRWLDLDNYNRVFLPFAVSLYHKDNPLAVLLSCSYAGLAAVLCVKAFRREIPWRLAAFCAVWLVAAAIPIYKLWGIGLDLEGARFTYFLTVAFAGSIAMLTLAPGKDEKGLEAKSTAIVGTALLVLCTFGLYKVCLRTNSVWVHASKEVRAVLEKAYALAITSPKESPLLVLGLPKKNAGAHMIYNGITFRLGLKEPVAPKDVSEQFFNFDPIFYGHDEYINSARFKRSLAAAGAKGPFVWNSDKLTFIDCNLIGTAQPGAPLALSATSESPSVQAFADGHATVNSNRGTFTFSNNQIGDGLQFNNLDLDPRQYDFLQFEYKLPADAAKTPMCFQAKWSGAQPAAANPQLAEATVAVPADQLQPGSFQSLRIPLSHHWRWYANGHLTSLALIMPPVPGIQVRDVVLLSDASLRPKFSAVDAKSDVSGVHVTADKTVYSLDASAIPGAAQLEVQSTKPDYFFDQIDGNIEEGIFAKRVIAGAKYTGALPAGAAPKGRYCEVRIRALDAAGRPLGEYSEPVTIYLANRKYIPSLW